MENLTISYILAGYNEEKLIDVAIQKTILALERDFSDYEIILVDDASTDKTGLIMDRYAQMNNRIKVMHNVVNLNFGTSVLRGILSATKDWVIYNAVDLPLLPEETADFIHIALPCDVLVLERTIYGGIRRRKVMSQMNSLLLHILFPRLMKGTPITNYIQIFKRTALPVCIPLARSPIFVWPEMIFRAKLAGLKVGNQQHTPHTQNKRSGAFGKPHDIIWGVYEMLRFRIRCWKHKI